MKMSALLVIADDVFALLMLLNRLKRLALRGLLDPNIGLQLERSGIGLSEKVVPVMETWNASGTDILFCGDYNKILDITKKSGDRLRTESQLEDFKCVVSDCSLLQFPFTGYKFTWSNYPKNAANVQAQLNKGSGNLPLLQQWGNFTTHFSVVYSSNNHPILIQVFKDLRKTPDARNMRHKSHSAALQHGIETNTTNLRLSSEITSVASGKKIVAELDPPNMFQLIHTQDTGFHGVVNDCGHDDSPITPTESEFDMEERLKECLLLLQCVWMRKFNSKDFINDEI
ncbi:PREDICTED: M569_00896 partial [Prunus dulcis]|uniref:PREDICTED: M569_00896 partial n=1 Tax=Prunus dulcis TaxID=3755 RepID=A0A5E4G722_PRUDU|nr:PREDICTED: M569_00896 partial [Prunus dulcis]